MPKKPPVTIATRPFNRSISFIVIQPVMPNDKILLASYSQSESINETNMAEFIPITRNDYRHFYPISTRWMDNDYYGHVNNATYYAYFDTAVNRYLIEEGELDLANATVIGVVVNSGCTYKSPVAYPQPIEAGLRVDKLGNTSVHYGLAIFTEGKDQANAFGQFVHVFVDRVSNKPVPIPLAIRNALSRITIQHKQIETLIQD